MEGHDIEWKKLLSGFLGAILGITGIQLMLVLPIHFIGLWVFDRTFWPNMDPLAGVFTLVFGVFFLLIGIHLHRKAGEISVRGVTR